MHTYLSRYSIDSRQNLYHTGNMTNKHRMFQQLSSYPQILNTNWNPQTCETWTRWQMSSSRTMCEWRPFRHPSRCRQYFEENIFLLIHCTMNKYINLSSRLISSGKMKLTYLNDSHRLECSKCEHEPKSEGYHIEKSWIHPKRHLCRLGLVVFPPKLKFKCWHSDFAAEHATWQRASANCSLLFRS